MGKMGIAKRRIEQRKKAFDIVHGLMNNPDNVLVIHYSCESFYDRIDGSSPRITSIAVRDLASGQTKSFSIHQMAEREKINYDQIEKNYNHLEKIMLGEFYDYVRGRAKNTWVHWNMRDINFGFAALAHRCRVLGSDPAEISDSKLVDLARLLKDIYGVDYIGHPHLEKLVEKNEITKRDFLSGAEESQAFENMEYVKLHQSTLRKVHIIINILKRVDNKTLKTNAKRKDIYGNNFVAIGEFIKDSWVISIITFFGTIFGIIMFIVWIIEQLNP